MYSNPIVNIYLSFCQLLEFAFNILGFQAAGEAVLVRQAPQQAQLQVCHAVMA